MGAGDGKPVWHESRPRLGGHPTWLGGLQIIPPVHLAPLADGGWRLEVWVPSPDASDAFRPLCRLLPFDQLASWLLAWEADPEGLLLVEFAYRLPEWTVARGAGRVPAAPIRTGVSLASLDL